MKLADATPEQIAGELMRRGIDFILIVDEGEAVNTYSPPAISETADTKAAGMFRMVRDYLNHLDNQ